MCMCMRMRMRTFNHVRPLCRGFALSNSTAAQQHAVHVPTGPLESFFHLEEPPFPTTNWHTGRLAGSARPCSPLDARFCLAAPLMHACMPPMHRPSVRNQVQLKNHDRLPTSSGAWRPVAVLARSNRSTTAGIESCMLLLLLHRASNAPESS
jgi:hypothetical protein